MSELVRVAGGSETAGDVIFVHGLDGDARGTWQASGDPASFWPAWLGDDTPGLGVWTLDYDAHALNWSGASMPLTDRAVNALDLLDLHIPDGRPVCFVAHSLGGLLVKQIVRRAVDWDHRLARQARGVVFLATPHAGSQKATWLANLGALVRASVSVAELQAHSPQLRDLNVWYRDRSTALGIRSRTYYETRAVRGLTIVDATSADPGIPGAGPIPLDADHISISKPAGRGDQLYLGVVQFLRQCLDVGAARASPLKVRFQVSPLDGRVPVHVGDTTRALPGGAKYRLQLTNAGSAPLVVDTLCVRLVHRPLPAMEAPRVDAGALRFGDARVPHVLHLEVGDETWGGRWVLQWPDGRSAIRAVPEGLDNLLDTEPPTELDIPPGTTETITGSITTRTPGVYEVALEISGLGAGDPFGPTVTEAVPMVHFDP